MKRRNERKKMKRRNEIFFGKTRNLERKKKKCVLVYQVGLLKIFVSFSPFETSLEQSIEGEGGRANITMTYIPSLPTVP